jgi:tetratricopeptide (TPR) repeat protein
MRSKKRLYALLNIWLGLAVIPHAIAADNTSQPALPGVKFTKVQDLDPNKAGPNRPIRQKWAVCVGISKFKESRLVSNDPVEDSAAKAFSEYLVSPKGGRFDAKHVRTLTNSKATKQAILNSLGPQWLGSLARADDLVVVFVSTNSFPTTDGSAYLGAYDCALDNIYGTCISMQDLMKTIKDNVKAERVLLIVQASYSGATDLAGGGKARPVKPGDGSGIITGSGFIVMTSCEPHQMSWSNIFSTNLIAQLKEKDGLVALGEAFEKTRTKTEEETTGKQFTAKQTPMLKTDWKGKDLIIGAKAVEEASDIPVNISDFLAAESYYFRANDLVTQGKVDEAIAQYQKAIETDPAYADALADLGAIYSLQKQPEKAADLYQRAIKEKPNDALFRTNYARVLAQLGRIPDSKSELERAYQLNPKDKVVLTALANYHLKDRDTAGALKFINEAIALYPNAADLFDKLSFAQVQSGNIAEAVQSAQKAVSLDPKSLSAKLNLGSTLMLSGDLNQATKAYLEATKLAPQDATAHFLLSKTLEKSGDLTGAKDELAQFIKCADPNDPRKKQAEEKLRNM